MTSYEKERLKDYMNKVVQRADNFIGYPIATDFDYSDLYPLLKYPLNNVGDPLKESTYDLNSRSIEREVVQFFAELFRAPKENSWGYVTNGGSEGMSPEESKYHLGKSNYRRKKVTISWRK